MDETDFSPWLRYDLELWGPLADPRHLIRIKGRSVVYNQNATIPHIYVVKSGRVRLSYYSSEGAEKVYLFALPGAMFGEETCFEPTAQFLYAETITDCEFYCIPKDEFLLRLSQNIALSSQVLSSMAHKIHVLMEHIRRLSFLDSKSRTAAVFVDLCPIFGIPTKEGIQINLPITQQNISNLVNASRLTVNQVVKEFEALGYLRKTKGFWYVYDLDALTALSQITHRRRS